MYARVTTVSSKLTNPRVSDDESNIKISYYIINNLYTRYSRTTIHKKTAHPTMRTSNPIPNHKVPKHSTLSSQRRAEAPRFNALRIISLTDHVSKAISLEV